MGGAGTGGAGTGGAGTGGAGTGGAGGSARQAARPSTALTRAGLPDSLGAAVAEFDRHLALERGLSPHSVRAYRVDVVSLLDHLARMGRDLAQLDIVVLRSWLARLRSTGAARATLARRAAAAGTFTAYAYGRGLLPQDPGPQLASPRPYRTLPPVLRHDEARGLVDGAAVDGTPIGLRDRLALELLYSTGIRVGELVRLDVDDIDRGRW